MSALRDPIHFIAFGFGAGLAPRAPGTFGSLVGLAAAWWLHDLPLVWRAGAVLVVIAAGILICGESARRLKRHDDQRIVLDEIAGVLLTSLAVAEKSLFAFALVFVFFRFFDIFKPWPIRDVPSESLPRRNGWESPKNDGGASRQSPGAAVFVPPTSGGNRSASLSFGGERSSGICTGDAERAVE
jgi:phosphatidylglycerophosphatase A